MSNLHDRSPSEPTRNSGNGLRSYLSQNFGIDASRLQPQGFGKNQPIAPNANPDGSDNPQGRQKNRRGEVVIRTQPATGG